jgi:hypothetical protein
MRYRVRITLARTPLVIVRSINRITIRQQTTETKVVWF